MVTLTFRIKGLELLREVRVGFFDFFVVDTDNGRKCVTGVSNDAVADAGLVRDIARDVDVVVHVVDVDVVVVTHAVVVAVAIVDVIVVVPELSVPVQVGEEVCRVEVLRALEDCAEFLLGRRHRLALDVEQRLDVILDGVTSRLPGPVQNDNKLFELKKMTKSDQKLP
jgi:hypothetical protein